MTVTDGLITMIMSFVVAFITIAKPLINVNSNITKLNANFDNMMRNDEIRDARIKKHGEEIDAIKTQQKVNEKLLDRHELRISRLEEERGIFHEGGGK